jgi:hypothetical protein
LRGFFTRFAATKFLYSIDWNLHACVQFRHTVHAAASIDDLRFSVRMAEVGQTRSHLPQPTHDGSDTTIQNNENRLSVRSMVPHGHKKAHHAREAPNSAAITPISVINRNI